MIYIDLVGPISLHGSPTRSHNCIAENGMRSLKVLLLFGFGICDGEVVGKELE